MVIATALIRFDAATTAERLHARSPRRARKMMREHLESNRSHIADSVKVAREQDGDQIGAAVDGAPEVATANGNGKKKTKRTSRSRAKGVRG